MQELLRIYGTKSTQTNLRDLRGKKIKEKKNKSSSGMAIFWVRG